MIDDPLEMAPRKLKLIDYGGNTHHTAYNEWPLDNVVIRNSSLT